MQKTGWPPGLLQDDDKRLSKWFASRPDARHQVRKNLKLKTGENMNFGEALEALKAGKKAARSGWNGKGLWVQMQVPDAHSKMTLPYLYLNYPQDAINTPGARVPWLASQTDILAEDWNIF